MTLSRDVGTAPLGLFSARSARSWSAGGRGGAVVPAPNQRSVQRRPASCARACLGGFEGRGVDGAGSSTRRSR